MGASLYKLRDPCATDLEKRFRFSCREKDPPGSTLGPTAYLSIASRFGSGICCPFVGFGAFHSSRESFDEKDQATGMINHRLWNMHSSAASMGEGDILASEWRRQEVVGTNEAV